MATTKAVATTAVQTESIIIPRIQISTMHLKIIGDSPLIMHAWSDKAKREMLDKQMKKAKVAKAAKDPWQDYVDSMHWITPKPKKGVTVTENDITKAKFGFPSIGFKAAAVDACTQVSGVTKVLARGAFHVSGEMVEIDGMPTMREDMVRIAMGTADIRYRAEFAVWSAVLPIRYNTSVLSPEQIANLFETAGFAVGVGEWRPEKNGAWGMFHVAREGE